MKILITAQGDFVAPRFDLTAEVVIATVESGVLAGKPRTIIMDRPSPEDLSAEGSPSASQTLLGHLPWVARQRRGR